MSAPEVVIIGGGLMGAASAWALARRSVPVLLVEQFAPGHRNGSSHGSARIVRRAYRDPLYVALTGRAFDLWDQLDPSLIRRTGGIDFGERRDVPAIAAELAAADVPHDVLSAAAAADRWPGMRFTGEVLFHPQAGTLDADAAVARLLRVATEHGADVRHGTSVVSLAPAGDAAELTLSDGSALRARAVVVAAGAWLPELLGGLVELPPLHVTEQPVFHFPRRDPGEPPWPSVIHEADAAVYHLPGGGAADHRKLGQHRTRDASVRPAGRSFAVDPPARARAVSYVGTWLPGLVAQPQDESTCLYTSTPSEDFVLDRVGPLVVCSPCSGHGAKFAPLIGELVASLVLGTDSTGGADGTGGTVPARFRLAAHLARRGSVAGAVSL
jgi:sarcosine oxidase